MKETGPLDSHRTNSAKTILEFLARNVRCAVGQRPAARNIVLIVAAAALCCGLALYFGASRTSAEREHSNHDWPNHGKDLANTRFQNLDQINPSNVKNLQVAWVFHTGVLDLLSELEATPIEVDGRLFITDGHDDVFALHAATGQQLWKFDGFNDEAQLAKFFLCCGRNNHGVAFGDGKVFVGRFDDSVVALNAETGKVAWKSTVADFHDRVAINSAPQFVEAGGRELVVISLSGGEFEIRGQVFALDAKTGKTVWRFSTTQPNSFAGQSFLTGGGAVFQMATATQPYSAVEPMTPLRFDQLTAEEQPDTAAITAAFPSFLAPGQTEVALSPQYTPPDETLRLIMPGDNGGCEWNPAAFSPRTKFVYYGARHDPDVFKTHSGNSSLIPQAVNGDLHLGSTFFNHVPGPKPFGLYGATDTRTGKVVWKIRLPQPAKSGVLVAGDVVFFGEGNGKFDAADAKTGNMLFTFEAPANITDAGGAAAGPIAYLADGREFVVNAFGGNVPDRSITANGNCLGGGHVCDNPVGDAFIAFALPRRGD